LYAFEGLDRVEMDSASAGEIVALAGLEGVEIGLTITDLEHPDRLEGIAVEEPTISVDFLVNNSPFAGRDGKFVTSRQVRERLYRELERNVALRVEDTDSTDSWTVSGRGELHLSILMETMRREGFEFQVSRPRVITRVGANGERLEPYEELMIDVPEGFLGAVIEARSTACGDARIEPGAGYGASSRTAFLREDCWISQRVLDGHPRNWRDSSPVSRLRPVGGSARRANARDSGVDGGGHDCRIRSRELAGAVDVVRVTW
jgi:GTP-binding protein